MGVENKKTLDVFENSSNYKRFMSATGHSNAKDRIAYGQYRGGYVYNFWGPAQCAWLATPYVSKSYQTEQPNGKYLT